MRNRVLVLGAGVVVLIAATLAAGTLLVSDGLPARAADDHVPVPTYDLAGIGAVGVLSGQPPGNPGYFPREVTCGWLLEWLPPPDHLLREAPTQAPTPLFAASMESVSGCALKPEWLPEEPATWFLAHGEGAYRARTAHLCWAYEANGSRVVAKGFPGQFVMLIHPPPVTVPPAVEEVLRSAPGWVQDPCGMIGSATYPWRSAVTTVPGPVGDLLAQLRDAMLAPAAGPKSGEAWTARLEHTALLCGGLWLSYAARGPIHDVGLGGEVPGLYSVDLWTNGRVLKVGITLSEPPARYTELFRVMCAMTELPVPSSLSAHVLRVQSQSMWCDGDGRLVSTHDEATHERVRVALRNGGAYSVLVPLPIEPRDLEQATWLCYAKDRTRRVHDFSYRHQEVLGRAGTAGVEEFDTWLRRHSALCLAAAGELREAGVPGSLAAAKAELLGAIEPVEKAWHIALEVWEKALREHDGQEGALAAFATSMGERGRQESATDTVPTKSLHEVVVTAARQLDLVIEED